MVSGGRSGGSSSTTTSSSHLYLPVPNSAPPPRGQGPMADIRRARISASAAASPLDRVEEAVLDEDDDEFEQRRRRRRLLRQFVIPSKRMRVLYTCLLAALFYQVVLPALVGASSRSGASKAPNASPQAKTAIPQAQEAGTVIAGQRRRQQASSSSQFLGKLPDTVVSGQQANHPIVDGCLVVDPSSTMHPLHQLIRDARKRWTDKLTGQSRTLKDAVTEYRRRYGRAPPVGFDKWWHYVVENDVQLPDEYDQINKDLLPFWAVKPKDLRKQIEEASFGPDTFTLRVKRGLLRTTHTYLPTDDPGIPERRDGQVELIKPIAKYLPDMTAVYTVHDTPHSLISWDFREDILEHIADGEYLDENDKVEATYHGWASACSWAAPINKAGGGGGGRRTGSRKGASKGANDAGTKEGQKSFIVDHAANMDICNHPEHVELHGLLAGKDVYVTGLGTTFAISKTTLHADVLGVPPERVVTPEFVPEIPWEEKVGDTLFWRGSTTGVDHRVDVPWRHTQRPRLTAMTANHTGVTTLLSPPGLMKSGASVADSAIVASNRDLSRKYTDVGFVSPVLQCSFDDGTCDNLKGEYPWLPRVTYETTDTHKYVIDVDGNAWSARFQRLLMSGSLVFKSTIIPEWWTDRIQPWVHYVPVKVDYSDLYDAFAFFAGDVDGRGGEDELARGVATAARQWSSTFFRDVDMTAYVFRLYLEWARLQAPHRGSGAADFVYDESMEALVE